MVYIFLAEGFEEIEALAVVDILRRAKIDVKTVSVSGSEYITGSHAISVKADIGITDIDESFDMIVFPGGMPGAVNLESSADVKRLTDFAVKNGRYVAAICASPSIIGKWGYLKGRKATCYPSYEPMLEGAEVVFDDVVCDGQFITSRGAGTAHTFAFKITELLKDAQTAEQIKKSMQY